MPHDPTLIRLTTVSGLHLRSRMAGALPIALAAVATAPATGAGKATGPGAYTVIPKAMYVDVKPGGPFLGTLKRGQTFIVARLSQSGKYAYGHSILRLNYLRGWVLAAALERRSGPFFAGRKPCIGERVRVRAPVLVKDATEGPSASAYLPKGGTFLVLRLSPSGKYTYGHAYGGPAGPNREGWVNTTDLNASGCTATPHFTG